MESKVAVVTGGSRGIGRAAALALAREGMRIVVNYLAAEERAKEAVQEITQFSDAIAVKGDVSDATQVGALVEKTMRNFGRVDVLVNNAGILLMPGDWKAMTNEAWQRSIDVNLSGVFYCTRAFAPLFVEQRSGKIINVTSNYGMLGSASVVSYTAAKAGVINLTLAFAKELAPYVTVNAVAPGDIDTDMTRALGPGAMRSMTESNLLKRLGAPEDAANAIAFLASARADFITGQVLAVDGGHMLR